MVAKVSQASKLVKAAHAISFTPDSANVLVVGQDRTLTAVSLSALQVRGTLNWGQNTEGSTNATLRTLAVSSDGKYVALGDTHNRIQVFELSTMKVSASQKTSSSHFSCNSFSVVVCFPQSHATLPVFHTHHTALAFHPTLSVLLVAYSSFEYHVFDLVTKTLSKELLSQKIPFPTPKERKNKVVGITFHPQKPMTVLFYGLTYISPVNLNEVSLVVFSCFCCFIVC